MTSATTHTSARRNGTAPRHLRQGHQDMLYRDSAIDKPVADERGYWTCVDETDLAALGFVGAQQLVPTLLIPIHDVFGRVAFSLSRPDAPRLDKAKRPIKYESPAGARMVLDVHPRVWPHIGDPSVPLWVVEGIKKADSAISRGMHAIALLGVANWRGTNVMGGKTALACWNNIASNGRSMGIIFDSDARHKPLVLYEISKLTQFLESRDAAVKIVLLPDGPNGAKQGLDDYFVRGGTVHDLRDYVVDPDELAHCARPLLVEHPDTGEPLVLPPGYDWLDGKIARLDQRGHAAPIYTGLIYPTATGHDLSAAEETVTVAWSNPAGAPGVLTIPRATLTDARAFGALVGGAGAALHADNTRSATALLVETIAENRAALSRQVYASRLGLVSDGAGIILPAGAIGLREPVEYTGRPTIRIGADPDAYPDVLRYVLSWGDTPVFWLTLAMGLASPALARVRPRRNPAVYTAGPSGVGKTTAVQLATGCYGDPSLAPFKVDAARTTPAGILQTLEHLGGLPLLVDDAHMADEPRRLEKIFYSFANGQQYTRGGADGKMKGGAALAGTMLLTGEASPELRHAGAERRILFLDAGKDYPLGAPPESDEGAQRAAELERAWAQGAGLFGYAVIERIWSNWSAFRADVSMLEAHPALEALHAWRTPLAIGAATLSVALDVAGIVQPDCGAWLSGLIEQWSIMLLGSRRDHDPAVAAWDALMTMLAQGQHRHDGDGDLFSPSMNWEWVENRGEKIAWRKASEDYWRVPTGSQQFKERIGVSAVQLHGRVWAARGWIREPDGSTTTVARGPNGIGARVLCVPCDALTTWGDDPALHP